MDSDHAAPLPDETDLRLAHLLQIAPRASWADAARVLGGSPTMLASRWRRLEADGSAWLSVYPNPQATGWQTAFVELDVRGVRLAREEVLQRLCAQPAVVGVSETDRLGSLTATVFAPDQPALVALLLDELPQLVPGIDAIVRIAVRVHAEGAQWRLDALTEREQRAAAGLAPARAGQPRVERAGDDAVIAALIEAPRAPIATLARTLGQHPTTVHRRVQRLLADGSVSMRCDLSPRKAGWQVERTWLLEAPMLPLDAVAARLRGMRELRLAASLSGDAQLAVTAYSRTLAASVALEPRILDAFPEARVVGRVHHLRTRKRMGRVLDAEERPVSRQPLPA
ncbi:transcriptional regulator, AsnC family [Agrococcus baldri]|uniref:Transcriptional regulator, AsnC family n=1 Tax=Agrococcus baldri TaxID=153730 RepID=A0AA94HMU6_9MICO|nr:AsnC family transcriptional regulator [Agrococcus baldri]SFS12115.1 transcriptional regulator, AsnC family [Agrococcus baldri]